MPPHDIFISYSSKDKLTVDKICSFLEDNGISCWITPRDVLPGSNWGESIIDAIYDARAILLVFSSNSNISEHIKREVERAVSRGKAIIPFRIEDVMPCKSLEYFISAQHWLDAYTPPLEKHLQHLVKTIKVLLSKIDDEPEMDEPEPDFEPPPEVQAVPVEAHQVPPAPEETITPPPRMERSETTGATGVKALLERIQGNVAHALIFLAVFVVLITILFWWSTHEPSVPEAVPPTPEVTKAAPTPAIPATPAAPANVNQGAEPKSTDQKLLDYNKALEINAQDIEALTKRAGLYYSKGDYDKALVDYDKIISLKSDNAEIYNARGNVHLAKGEYDAALKDFNQAISLDANSVNSYVNRGNTHYFNKNYDAAIKDFTAAIKLKPDFAIAYNNRGKVQATKKENQLALEDFNKAITLDPTYGKAYKNRAMVNAEQGKIDQAISDLNMAIALKTDLAESYFQRGKLYEQKGDEKKAAEDFDQAKALDPNLKS